MLIYTPTGVITLTRTFAARDGTILDLDDKPSIVLYVQAKLEEQGSRAATISGACEYRTTDGRACAAGWLLSDSIVNAPGFANTASFHGLRNNCPAVTKHFGDLTVEDVNFVLDLQSVHDSKSCWDNPASMAEAFNGVRKRYPALTAEVAE